MNQKSVWQGWHGTSVLSGNQIIGTTFKISQGGKDWLGDGAYFFVEDQGVSDPEEKAAEWAISRSGFVRGSKYSNFSVLLAEVEVENFLDFDDPAHIVALNKLKQEYIAVLMSKGRRPTDDMMADRCNFCNYLFDEHEVEAMFRREYIKTSQEDLDYGFNGGVPNCRIMSVRNPAASVRKIDYAIERRSIR